MCVTGTIGNEVQLVSNYFEMTSRPDFHLLQYRVDFKPDIEHTGVKKALIRVHENSLGKYVFDGTLLYAVKRLPQVTTSENCCCELCCA